MVTVETQTAAQLKPGQQAIFFTQSLIHGRGIAVREMDRTDASEEPKVVAMIADLPRQHLRQRLLNAAAVIDGEVGRINEVEQTIFDRNGARWAAAEIEVNKVFRGPEIRSVVVYFPTSKHPLWSKSPRFKPHQRGIFILHAPDREASPSQKALGRESLVSLDPADFQPESQLDEVRRLLGEVQ
jgi:hypothetical protein